MTALIISILMDTIYRDFCDFIWFPHCAQQQLNELNAGINKKMKKQCNTSTVRLPRLDRLINHSTSLFNNCLGVGKNILFSGSWEGFMIKLTNGFFRE